MSMNRLAHKISTTFGVILVFLFLISTVISEVFGSLETITTVKRFIMYGVLVLIPIILVATVSGQSLAGTNNHLIILKKKKRMTWIGLNTIIVLIPSAIALYFLSSAENWGIWYVTIQVLEITSGITSVILMGLNIRDGIKLRDIS
jgi:hypothetical protein